MKKFLVVLLSLAFGLFFVGSAMAAWSLWDYLPDTGVNNTVHDLSLNNTFSGVQMPVGYAGADPLNRICIYCHTPHHAYRLSTNNGLPGVGIGSGPIAGDPYTYLPLWNHDLTTQSFIMYDNGPGAPDGATSSHGSQAISNGMTPGSTSMLCLSCHDGTVSANAYGNTTQPVESQGGGGGDVLGLVGEEGWQIGKDGYLGNHHPIGFSYTDVVNGTGASGITDTEIRAISHDMGTAGKISDHLYGTDMKMECGSCHAVHNKGNTGERLLWRSDENSRLCLTCHDKGTDPTNVTP